MIHARRRSRVRSMRSGRGCETGPGDDPRASLSSASCVRKWTVSAASGHPEIGATKPCKMGAAARLRRGGLHRTVLDAPARPGAAADGLSRIVRHVPIRPRHAWTCMSAHCPGSGLWFVCTHVDSHVVEFVADASAAGEWTLGRSEGADRAFVGL